MLRKRWIAELNEEETKTLEEILEDRDLSYVAWLRKKIKQDKKAYLEEKKPRTPS